ncbi:murein biosynthesis integral membrane protein MurJ [Sphingomonas sp. 2R-10]|uniref:murein biosynthesis integral membrane protein MurJ n=1 Tax=Sphingomonas sp. 2R-10 TaxID=3045148 RepID=UPI000F779ACC|nr:murein biosynthesis integral membrane protein MurJ [Sphingomonas sp. 2R-10]MDJ0275618.1 murein biosynthesis integral membrane protein MurJ [Sphingomonas sp. 2R-10]
MKLAKSLGSVGGLTLASRVLALVRDSLQATFVGAGFASDAFLVAFRLPNMFRALFAEGAFNAAFVPLFSQKVAEGEEATEGQGLPTGIAFARDVLSVLLPVLIAATIVMLIAAWPLTWLLSGGFNDPTPDQFAYAVTLSRITIPYLLLISIVSLLGAILNSLDKFWVNAAAPILLNVAMVAGLLFFHGPDPYATARVQAWTVTIGGALQLGWLMVACRRAGVSLRPRRPRLTPDVRRMLRLIVPAAAGAGAMQVNLVVSTALSGKLLDAGSISYIYYADRLNQLPLGLIGIGLGTILLPTISRQLNRKDDAGAMDTQNRGIELALLLTLPATIAFLTVAEPIIRALFQHGAFGAEDTIRCAQALAAFSLGLPAYVLIKVLTPGFYARQDTRTPVRFAMWSIAINIVLNLMLIPTIAHIGPPLATAIAAWVNVAMLYWTLRRRGHFALDRQLTHRLPRFAVAALLMGGALFFADTLVAPWTTGAVVTRVIGMVALVGAGAIVYGLACLATGAFRLADLRALLRRRAA